MGVVCSFVDFVARPPNTTYTAQLGRYEFKDPELYKKGRPKSPDRQRDSSPRSRWDGGLQEEPEEHPRVDSVLSGSRTRPSSPLAHVRHTEDDGSSRTKSAAGRSSPRNNRNSHALNDGLPSSRSKSSWGESPRIGRSKDLDRALNSPSRSPLASARTMRSPMGSPNGVNRTVLAEDRAPLLSREFGSSPGTPRSRPLSPHSNRNESPQPSARSNYSAKYYEPGLAQPANPSFARHIKDPHANFLSAPAHPHGEDGSDSSDGEQSSVRHPRRYLPREHSASFHGRPGMRSWSPEDDKEFSGPGRQSSFGRVKSQPVKGSRNGKDSNLSRAKSSDPASKQH
mmetsp:Transcript_29812/g.46752  ORF Transcript_29812/g.46752 Transcript_29812/m.46752 type:complete len:340 (+) Transcript_29812:13-1032(+)